MSSYLLAFLLFLWLIRSWLPEQYAGGSRDGYLGDERRLVQKEHQFKGSARWAKVPEGKCQTQSRSDERSMGM
jgi:hypothetical protein